MDICQTCSDGVSCDTCLSGLNRGGAKCDCNPGFYDNGVINNC